jgi:hypothetical protein
VQVICLVRVMLSLRYGSAGMAALPSGLRDELWATEATASRAATLVSDRHSNSGTRARPASKIIPSNPVVHPAL